VPKLVETTNYQPSRKDKLYDLYKPSVSVALYAITRVIKMIKQDSQPATKKSSAILDQLNTLKREDETLYNILAVDVWALAKTMDEFQPGFWSAFMTNREKAMKRFIAEVIKNKPVDPKRPPFLR
jgi:hypothetical protein